MSTAGRRVSPDHLSREARDLWLAIEREYYLEDVHCALLTAALECWDRAREAREILDEEGIVVRDRFGQRKPHPATKIQKNALSQFRLLIRELGLDFADVPDAHIRPPRVGG